jgi:transcriptional regulator with XRE-family HTH domain
MDRGAIFRTNLRKARKVRGWSQEELATAAGFGSKGHISDLENGNRPIPPIPTLSKLAGALDVTLESLIGSESRPSTVPLVGYVGAGAEAHFYASGDAGLGEVEAPDGATMQTVAVEVHGTSLGPLFESWLVFYDDVRRPVTTDLVGRLCVVGLANDKVLVKKLRKAEGERFHLLSNQEETMFDQEVVWAARVKSMAPR